MGKPTHQADAPISETALAPVLDALLERAKFYGADQADAIATHGRSLSVTVRDRALEDVDNSEGKDIGLRVMVGQRQASVSSSDLSSLSIDKLVERAVAMAKLAPEDPYCGLAPTELLQKNPPDLELYDDTLMTPAKLKSRAHDVEAATAAVKGVDRAEGSSASFSSSAIYFKTSHGFSGGWRSSRHGLSGVAIAEKDGAMERDYSYEGARWFEDLPSPDTIGREAGERAVARLGATQMPSGALPVIFDRRVANSLIAAVFGAISGTSIARGTSFLKDKMGAQIFSPDINIIDDPTLKRGHGSRPWDGEGVATQRRNIIEDGKLTTWLLNCSTAKQLGLQTTGHAMRGIGGPPGISSTNSWLAAGKLTPDALYKLMGNGLLISEMFGPSLNNNTGDYSVGVSGFQIKNGERTTPVNEITIAGNLIDVYSSLIAANDLKFDGSKCAPSVLVEGLTLAGS
jgi:PmbA protein